MGVDPSARMIPGRATHVNRSLVSRIAREATVEVGFGFALSGNARAREPLFTMLLHRSDITLGIVAVGLFWCVRRSLDDLVR